MKKKTRNLFIILILIFSSFDIYNKDSEWSVTGNVIRNLNQESGIKIANWNLQIFGVSKANNLDLMKTYADKINDFDIIFIQEIRDSSQESFNKLCSLLDGYSCEISSRAGRTSNKEQYGIIFNNSIRLNYIKDYNLDIKDRWERPPIEVSFDLEKYNLTIFNIHVKPDDVKNELNHLDDVALNKDYTAILGDLNSDCSYYDNSKENEFESFNWIIQDNEDTTVGDSNCAYDRIILSNELNKKLIRYDIYKEVKKEESDHYLIWFEIYIR